jgi:hypothetical protein
MAHRSSWSALATLAVFAFLVGAMPSTANAQTELVASGAALEHLLN